jgi:putative membrane protein
MTILSNVMVGLVAALHFYFMILEMFLWDKPAGMRAFGHSPEDAATTKLLAANQGLYNGFLVAGLVWGLILGAAGGPQKVFFLGCVIVAGIYGAITVARKILFVQAVPATITLALVFFAAV